MRKERTRSLRRIIREPIPTSEREGWSKGGSNRGWAKEGEGVIEARMWAWRGMATHPIFIITITTSTTTLTFDARLSELPCSCLPPISSYSCSASCNRGHSISTASHLLTSQPICSPAGRMVRDTRFHLTLRNWLNSEGLWGVRIGLGILWWMDVWIGCMLVLVVETWKIGVMGRWPWVFLGIEYLRNTSGGFKGKWASKIKWWVRVGFEMLRAAPLLSYLAQLTQQWRFVRGYDRVGNAVIDECVH